MYLNKNKMAMLSASIKVKTWIWGILTGATLMAVFGCFVQTGENKTDASTTIFAIVLTIFNAVMLSGNIINKQKLEKAARINNVFENDADGVMMLHEIASAIHFDKDKIEKLMLYLMNKGILINCRFDDRNSSRILLTDVNVASTNEFVVVVCQACGTQVQVRPGQAVKCPACGTFIAQ